MSAATRRRCLAGALLAAALGLGRVAAAADPTPGYLTIQRMFLQEDFEQATALAQSFLMQSPAAPEAPRVWLWLALSLDRLERANEALRELDRLKAQMPLEDPVWAEALFWEGEISRRALQMVRARLAYQRLIERYPTTTWANQAQLGMGLIYLHQQTYDLAIGHLHEVALRQPGTAAALDARLFEGLCHLQVKQYLEAIGILEPLISELQMPNAIAQASFYLGESLTGSARYEDAIRAYQRAIASATTAQWSQPALFGLGWASYQANHCEESVKAFDRYLRRASEDHRTEALFAQGACLLRLERDAEALVRFEEIVAHKPAHPLALDSAFVMVDAYRREERFSEAKELLHAFLRRRLEPAAHAQVQLRLAALALDQGNAAQAKTIFSLAAESGEPPVRQAALNGLGDVALFLGDPSGAKRSYDESVQSSGDTPLARYASYQLARIHLQQGAFNEAIAILQRLSVGEDSRLADDAKLGLVIAYLNQHEEPLARSLLETLRVERPGSPIASRAAYYQALLALGEDDEASVKRLCQEVIERVPRAEEAMEARLLLADLQARAGSARDVIEWLTRVYHRESLSRSQRAKLAKRLGDLARTELACDEAIDWYGTAADLLPSLTGEAVYRMASCYEEAGDYEIAMRWYRQIEQRPWRVRGRLALAKLLERQERPAEAKAIYEALAKEPIPEARMVQERLAALQAELSNKERR
ncbi:MAG: tetratricopeptide repeat protein [Candidatus Omnitrophica bacterium]|nr:tetratricopeptide repeat protein [Candidatus Omnitrophota bacterium]